MATDDPAPENPAGPAQQNVQQNAQQTGNPQPIVNATTLNTPDANAAAQADGQTDEDSDQEGPENPEQTPEASHVEAVPTDVQEKPNPLAWMTTFADLTALMLTFFVILFSMSIPNPPKWTPVMSKLQTSFREQVHQSNQKGSPLNIETHGVYGAANTGYLGNLLAEDFRRQPLLNKAHISPFNDYLVITFADGLFFKKGSDYLVDAEQDLKILDALTPILNQLQNEIAVYGHASDETSFGATSAEEMADEQVVLSLKRAHKIATHLIESGYLGELRLVGFGTSEADKLSESLPEDLRDQLGRRADIAIYTEAYGQ